MEPREITPPLFHPPSFIPVNYFLHHHLLLLSFFSLSIFSFLSLSLTLIFLSLYSLFPFPSLSLSLFLFLSAPLILNLGPKQKVPTEYGPSGSGCSVRFKSRGNDLVHGWLISNVHVFTSSPAVGWFVIRITQKLLNGLTRKLDCFLLS